MANMNENISLGVIRGYNVEKALGVCDFGLVVQARNEVSGQQVVMKIINKREHFNLHRSNITISTNNPELNQQPNQQPNQQLNQAIREELNDFFNASTEIDTLMGLRHPNLPRLIDGFQTDTHYFIVQDLIKGCDLRDLLSKVLLTENGVKNIFVQLINAVRYLHFNGFCHRDIKPENIYLRLEDNKELTVILMDFGLSQKLIRGREAIFSACGTFDYSAPEIKREVSPVPYNAYAADIWSCGAVLHEIFYDSVIPKNDSKVSISSEAASLLRNMLEPLPRDRSTMENIINHPWLNGQIDLLQQPTTAEPILSSTMPEVVFSAENIDILTRQIELNNNSSHQENDMVEKIRIHLNSRKKSEKVYVNWSFFDRSNKRKGSEKFEMDAMLGFYQKSKSWKSDQGGSNEPTSTLVDQTTAFILDKLTELGFDVNEMGNSELRCILHPRLRLSSCCPPGKLFKTLSTLILRRELRIKIQLTQSLKTNSVDVIIQHIRGKKKDFNWFYDSFFKELY